MVREDLVSSAITFLGDPGVASAPLDRRIAYLRSKKLTDEEINLALARAGAPATASGGAAAAASAPAQAPGPNPYDYEAWRPQPQPQPGSYGYPGFGWQPAQPRLPSRDWRDWFIVATLMSGVGYGLYTLAKRYIYPLIGPPTPPQLQQDKEAIDAAFTRAFAMLDQLVADTEALKAAEQARVERVDGALKEMEAVVAELKTSSARREDEARRLGRDVDMLRDLIEHGLNAHKDIADRRLAEVNTELKGLKTLVANRMTATHAKLALPGGGGDASSPSSSSSLPSSSSAAAAAAAEVGQSGSASDIAGFRERLTAYKRADEAPSAGDLTPAPPMTRAGASGTTGPAGPASENANGESRKDEHEAVGADGHRRTSFSSTRLPVVINRAAIPAWQMAAAVKKAPSNVDNAG